MKLFTTNQARLSRQRESSQMHELNTLIAFCEGHKQTRPILAAFNVNNEQWKDGVTTVKDRKTIVATRKLIKVTRSVSMETFQFHDLFKVMFWVLDICELIYVSINYYNV